MYVKLVSVTATTAADGSATAYSDPINGLLSQVRYVKTDFADGSTITMTAERTGETLWVESNVNASATRAPRQATHNTSGTATLYASGGIAVQDKIAVFDDRVKIVIASGGNTKTGTFYLTFI